VKFVIKQNSNRELKICKNLQKTVTKRCPIAVVAKADGVIDKVAKLNEIAKLRGQTMAQMAITWLLRDERITSVLIGASRVEQLAGNLQAAQAAPLTDEELQKIEKVLTS
jgi:aryl-alcohol dehydrogenase-like predicted oxidoreductase